MSLNSLRNFIFKLSPVYDHWGNRKFAFNWKSTQRYQTLPIYLDRLLEFKKYFNLKWCDVVGIFKENGFPTEKEFRRSIVSHFESGLKTKTVDQLYKEVSMLYSFRLMMGFQGSYFVDEFTSGVDYLQHDQHILYSLEYGCGVADYSLYLGAKKHYVSILDLDDEKLLFAENRLRSRGVSFEKIVVNNSDTVPMVDAAKYNIVVATEVMNFVKDPILVLECIIKSLKKGGFLFATQGVPDGTQSNDGDSWFGTESVGDRLTNAVINGNSKEYVELFTANFIKCKDLTARFWWKKK